jgi:hypothetical protein
MNDFYTDLDSISIVIPMYWLSVNVLLSASLSRVLIGAIHR